MLRSEVNLDKALWSLPPHRTKNNRAHEVPLSPAAIEIVLAALSNSNRTVLFGNEDRPFTGWSSAKTAIDKRIKRRARPLGPGAFMTLGERLLPAWRKWAPSHTSLRPS
jgi:integrase